MIYFLVGLSIYLSMGLSFTLAAWLQAAEKQVIATGKYDSFFADWKRTSIFIVLWLLIAIADYRSNITRTVPDLEYIVDNLKSKIKREK